MITIPKCFMCENYKDGKCPAYPEGIMKSTNLLKITGENCGNGVMFQRRAETEIKKLKDDMKK